MFVPELYRAKAAEYSELAKMADSPDDTRELKRRETSFTVLADNEQWLADHYDQTVHTMEVGGANEIASTVIGKTAMAAQEEHILRCLGASLIMQWNALPAALQRELFDNAGSMGPLLETETLRGQIARFLHRHRDGETKIAYQQNDVSQHGVKIAQRLDKSDAAKLVSELTAQTLACPTADIAQ
jgi:hypothetical protein